MRISISENEAQVSPIATKMQAGKCDGPQQNRLVGGRQHQLTQMGVLPTAPLVTWACPTFSIVDYSRLA